MKITKTNFKDLIIIKNKYTKTKEDILKNYLEKMK